MVRRVKRTIRRRKFPFRRFRRKLRRLRGMTPNSVRFFKIRAVDSLNVGYTGLSDNLFGLSEFGNIRGLFEWYRVSAIKVEFLPGFNVNQMGTSTTIRDNYIYLRNDWQTPSTPQTEAQMLNCESTKVRSYLRRFKCYFKLKKTIPGLAAGVNQLHGWQKTVSPTTTQSIAIFVAATGVPNPVGRIVVTYYVAAKYRA